MAKKKSHAGKKQFLAYKAQDRFTKNKLVRLRRHVKNCPNDDKSIEALSKLEKNCVYTRKASFKKVWNKSMKIYAKMLKQHGLNGNMAFDEDSVEYKVARKCSYEKQKHLSENRDESNMKRNEKNRSQLDLMIKNGG